MPATPSRTGRPPDPLAAKWQRWLLALSAIACLAVGVGLEFVPGMDASGRKFASGTALKIGVVLGLAWISAPQLQRLGWHRLRGTMLVAVIVVILLYAIRPRIGAMAATGLIAVSLLVSLVSWLRRWAQPLR